MAPSAEEKPSCQRENYVGSLVDDGGMPRSCGSATCWMVGRALTKELDQRVVLDRVLQTAREITGARYGRAGNLERAAL